VEDDGGVSVADQEEEKNCEDTMKKGTKRAGAASERSGWMPDSQKSWLEGITMGQGRRTEYPRVENEDTECGIHNCPPRYY
jgi:hypothetical protein